MKRLTWLVLPVFTLSLTAPLTKAAEPTSSPKRFVAAAQMETPLAQGLTLTTFERLYPSGWVNGWLLRVDLSHPAISTDLVTAPGVTRGEGLSSMTGRAGAVAAINGDFFDIGQTGIALGSVVRSGEVLQTRTPDWPNAAGVGKDRIGRLLDVTLDGTVTLPGGSYKLGAINLPTVPSRTIGLFTPLWTLSRDRAMVGATEAREVVVKAGKVISVSDKVTSQPIPADGFVLVGREEFAKPLAALKVGDPVTLSYRPKPDVHWAVGGYRYLVKGGRVATGLDDKQYKPRSALGFSADGRRMLLLAVDGRSELSGGLTLRELAEMMQAFGATDVLELDGGGSTTMVGRLPGAEGLSVLNRPSDGRERSIPNGVGVFAAPGSGVAHSLQVLARDEARVFPGLTRRLAVAAYDEQFRPAPLGLISWQSEGVGAVSAEGRFRSHQTGLATVTAQAIVAGSGQPVTASTAGTTGSVGPLARVPGATVTGKLTMRVLGPLDRIVVEGEALKLSPGQTGRFTVRGYDAEGYGAAIDPSDLTLTYDTSLLKVEAREDGVHVTPLKEGTGLIRVVVQGKEAWAPVASARSAATLNVFDNLTGWAFRKHPATVTGAISTAPGRTGTGLKLSYTFGKDASTRAAYLQASPPLDLPERPQSVGFWVKGDGQGAWLRAILVDAKGANHTLNLARHVDWTDWRFVEAPVPAGAAHPVKLYRIYPVETDTEKQYSGELIFDDLTVKVPVALPPMPVPPAAPVRPDPVFQQGGAPTATSWSFGLVGGLGLPKTGSGSPAVTAAPLGSLTAEGIKTVALVGTAPATPAEQEALRLIRQALAAKPAFLLVDPALTTPAEESLLAKEAGKTPIYRLTHPVRSIDVHGVRLIFTGTSGGGLRATQFEQLLELKTMLDLARRDAAVRQVVVFGHHTPAQFTDRREGDLVARWLTEFEELSGKPAVYLSGGGAARSVQRLEGIPFIQVGSPKGVQLITLDPAPGATWIRVNP
ncbi:MAG: phosphodiester glycosidase family protein [Bacillota bacterium]